MIRIAKGIIGHTTKRRNRCKVFSKGSITASYAQNAELQTASDIRLGVHSMSNEIRCGNNLIVMDSLKARHTRVAG
ncbi:FapA family protein [Vibrio chagasii]|nr:FapA family protein [Vibrio chagasii]